MFAVFLRRSAVLCVLVAGGTVATTHTWDGSDRTFDVSAVDGTGGLKYDLDTIADSGSAPSRSQIKTPSTVLGEAPDLDEAAMGFL